MNKYIQLLLSILLFFCSLLSDCRLAYAYDGSVVQNYIDHGKYEEAIEYLKEKIKVEPNNSAIYADMGLAYGDIGDHEHAVQFLKEAIRINSADSVVYDRLGWVYYDAANYDEAIKLFKEAIKIDPYNFSACNGLGTINEHMDNYSESIKWYRESISINPYNADGYCGMGNVYRKQQSYDEAIKCYKKAIGVDLNNSDGYDGLGRVYENMGNYEEAVKWFKESVKRKPKESYYYMNVGSAYYKMAKYDEALKWLKKGKKICRNCDSINEFLGRVYTALGKYDEAEILLSSIVEGKDIKSFGYWGCAFQALGELYSHMTINDQKKKVLENYMKAADIESNSSIAQIDAARKCYEYGDYGNAINYVERAIDLDKHSITAENNLLKGYILINMKRYKEAEDIFGKLRKEGTRIEAIRAGVGMGHIEITKGNYKLAEEYFREMLVLDNNDIMANLGMAWFNSNQNRHQKALVYYDSILSGHPFYILALLGKGNALMGLKRISEAESIFKEVLQIDSDNEYALAELGIVAYNKNDNKNAEELFNKALSKNNSSYTCPYEGLGLVYLQQGKIKEAEENFKKAIEINPGIEYKKYNGLAKIYIKQGKLKEARELLLKSIQNYPEDKEAGELLKSIESKT